MYRSFYNNGFKKCKYYLPAGYTFANSLFWSKYRGTTIITESDLLVCCAAVYLHENKKFKTGPFSYKEEHGTENRCNIITILYNSINIVQYTVDDKRNVLLEYVRDDFAILEELVTYGHLYAEISIENEKKQNSD